MYEEAFKKQRQLKEQVLMIWIATQMLALEVPAFRL